MGLKSTVDADGNATFNSITATTSAGNATIQGNTFNGNSQLVKTDAGGKIPITLLPTGTEVFRGVWDASTNTPTLSNATIEPSGYYYNCQVAGTVNFGAGTISFNVNDHVISNGTVWNKEINTNSVTSVNGAQGDVVLGIDNLSDVDTTAAANNDVLIYKTSSSEWKHEQIAPVAYSNDYDSLSNKPNITGQTLTGFAATPNTPIIDTDSILQAFGKSQAQINSLITSIINGGGYLSLTTGTTVNLTNPMPTFIDISNLGASFSLVLPPMNAANSLKASPLGAFIIQCTSPSTSQSCFLRNNSNTTTLLSIRGQKKYLCFVKSNATADGDFVFIDISTVTSATAPLTINNNGVLSMPAATSAQDGYLRAADFITFSAGRLLNVRVLSSGTSYTPTSGTTKINAFLLGAGAAGGGVNATNETAAGGGASGAECQIFNLSVSSATSYTYSIGSGGIGVSGANGGLGGNTTLIVGATTYTAQGGLGGSVSTNNRVFVNGGIPQNSINGTINISGNYGFNGISGNAVDKISSGAGASSTYGVGGRVPVNASSTGGNGTGFGAGGSGAINAGAGSIARAGGNGTGGLIVIYEFS